MSNDKSKNKVDKLLRSCGSDIEIANGIGMKSHICRDWRRRGSIPIGHWPSLYLLGVTPKQLLAAHDAEAA